MVLGIRCCDRFGAHCRPLSKRKDIQKAVETYCKLIDRHRDGVVERTANLKIELC